MSSNASGFSRTSSLSAVELQDLLVAARAARPSVISARRKRSKKAASRSDVAGTALVAALLGAQFAEEAAAVEDLADKTGDAAWLRRVRICAGHAVFGADENGARSHNGHDIGAVANHAVHYAVAGVSGLGADHFRHAVDSNDLMQSPGARGFGSARHGGHITAGDTASSAGGADGPASEPVHNHDGTGTKPATTSEPEPASGHNHTSTGGTTEPTSTTTTTTDPATTSGGHTHTGTTTTGSSSGGMSMPMDPAMMAEHAAVMNLVKVSAATHVAVTNGSWFDPNTWANGQVPGDGAKVVIPQGITVDYDGQSKASIFTVRVDGELDFATNKDTFMEVDTFVVTTTGTLRMGTEANPVDPNVHTVISFADNGPINVAWDPMLFSRGLISHGTVDIHGAEKETFLKVAVDPMRGDTTLTLEAPPTGWQVGDKLVLTGTHLVSTQGTAKDAPITAQTQDEELVIKSISGNVITLDRALTYDHEGARTDLKAYVANYSRNITFENEGGAATNVHERGHVMFGMSDNVVVKYAEFDELGRTDKSQRSFDVATLSSTASDTNIKARYALHLHHTGVGDQAHPAIVEGNAVWGSPGWGLVQHDSNAILSNNAAYGVFGAAFVAETGNETGRWDHNISIKSLGVNHITKDGADVNAFDLGRTGTGFWFQGRLVEAVDNVAAGVPSGAGFTYFHRGLDSFHIPIDPSTSPLSDSLNYLDKVRSNTPNISIFLNNESIATETGLEIIKANPRQSHDLRSMLDNFLAWEVKTGVHLEYTGHYTLRNLDVVASDSPGIATKYTVGLDLANNVFDVVVNNANIDGFYTGVRQAKHGVTGLAFMDTLDKWDYVYIDVNVQHATQAFTNRTAGDMFLTAADLTNGRLFYNSGFAETHIAQINGVYNISGVKTDSIGAKSGYDIWDPNYINTTELRGSIEQNGYWTTTDGRRVALIENYVSERATGDVIKVGLFVEIPTSYKLVAGGFTRITPVDHGVLNQKSLAPVAQDDVAHTTQGHSVVIDLLANDRDPDGDAIHVDGILSQHGHVVDNKDGSVTYFADPSFKGDDVFYYFVQDSNGDITKAQVTVTVDV